MKRLLLFVVTSAVCVATFAAPAIQAQQATQQPPLIRDFQKIEDQWSTSLVKQDQFTLETILSPTFVGISSTGEVMTRNQVVAALFEKDVPRPVMMEQRVVNVRVIEDVAIVDGTYIEQTKLNGIVREQRGVFTHVYQHVREVWKCVQSQRTALPVEAPEKKRKSKKKSSSSEPFHIPLFHKGEQSDGQGSAQPASQS
jgi:Domain of unknown function (DUF4440)